MSEGFMTLLAEVVERAVVDSRDPKYADEARSWLLGDVGRWAFEELDFDYRRCIEALQEQWGVA